MKRIIALILCLLLTALATPFVQAAPTYSPQELKMEKEAVLSALYEANITDISEALQLGLVTCEELTAYYLERIEAYNTPYNCFITLCAEDALETARQRDEQLAVGNAQGRLFGIPVVIKDNLDLEGVHTTNGYKKNDSQIAESNATVVQSLLDEGAVILGKTNMSTAAQDALRSYSAAVGETKNAYNTHLAAGGSSGGSAVATSLNFAVAALGTDTNSSLRIPAALAGCVSLRPTFGLLSNNGIKKLNRTRDTAGAITRTVRDQAIMLDVLTGGKYNYTENLDPDVLKGMRIGILEELAYKSGGYKRYGTVDNEALRAFEDAVQRLRFCGAEVITISAPKLLTLSERTMSTNNDQLKQNLYNAYLKVLEDNDVTCLIFPSYISAPQYSGKDANGTYWDVNTQDNINNCRILSPSAGLPEITLPMGTHSRGAGMGLQIAAPKNQEQLLLDIAYAYEQAGTCRKAPAGAEDLYASHNQGTLRDLITLQTRVEETQPEPEAEPTQPSTTVITLPGQEPEGFTDSWVFGLLALLILLLIIAVSALVVRTRPRKKRRHKTPMR